MWDKKLGKLLLRGIAQVELCRDSVLIPFSGYARSIRRFINVELGKVLI